MSFFPRRVLLGAAFLASEPVAAQPAPVTLFRIITLRDAIIIGLTPAELDALGGGLEIERIARRLASEGHLMAWRYSITRGPDGATQFGTSGRTAVLRHDSLRVEPYIPALPVATPPAESR